MNTNTLQQHPDYPQLQEAIQTIELLAKTNERIAAEEIHRMRQLPVQGDVTNQKILILAGLEGRNQAIKKSADDYLAVTAKRLGTFHSLEVVRDGDFPRQIADYQVQFELVKLRLENCAESRPDFFDIFECKGQWYVALANSTETLADFDTKEKAEAYAVSRRRRVRLLALLD